MAGEIEELIRRDGPITVAEFMRRAVARYYAGRDPLGARGDFVTAPEITQVFGELIGLWCVETWRAIGAPEPVALVELGPGRGTLMRDALRAMARVGGFRPALHLVETSPALRALQRDLPACWHDGIATVPRMPMLLLANEFFDALPVHQYVGDVERRVGLVDGRLAFLPDGDGAVAERAPERAALAAEIATRIAAHGGAALIVDYGYVAGSGDTLQAMRRHRRRDVLSEPGEADLTAHVDFGALAAAARARGARTWGPVPQGAFLLSLGIETRAARLVETATPDQAMLVRSGCRRLIDPGEMGTLFKVLAITRMNDPAPPGFEDTP
jgi:NADH dehydrogenase [ubiquinone] 1 alpha subcomplex assembly factor 7